MLIVSDAFVEGVVVEESKNDLLFLVTTCTQDLLVEEDVDNVALDGKEGGSAKPLFWSKVLLSGRTMIALIFGKTAFI